MKFINFYSGTALALIASLLGSLGAATGELAPPLIVGALLLTVLVLGWAGGASDARHEIDRLTRLESGRQLLAQSHIKQRDLLEAEVERLRAKVRDSRAAIQVFSGAQFKAMVRITALEGENAKLRARTTAEITAVSWPLQPFAIVYGRAMGSDDLELAAFDGVNYCFSDGDCHGREGDTLDGFTAEFLTQYQLEQRLIEAHLDAGSVAVLRTENAELRKRPSAEVMIETAVRLMRENSADEDSDQEYLNGRAAGIAHMHTELVQHMMAPAPAPLDSHPPLAPGAAVSASTTSTCGCHACLRVAGTTAVNRMVLCLICGNKRCPHANDHQHACTGSNEPGQPGSAYPDTIGAPAAGAQP